MRDIQSATRPMVDTPAPRDGSMRFADVVTRYQRPLFAYLFRMTDDAQDAEDLTQKTLLKAHAAQQHGAMSPNLSAWLDRIASNSALDALRWQRVRWLPWNAPMHDRLLHGDWEEQPEGATVFHEEQCMIQAVPGRLAPRHRQTLLLREYAGLSCDGMGTAVGASRTAVKSATFPGTRRVPHRITRTRIRICVPYGLRWPPTDDRRVVCGTA